MLGSSRRALALSRRSHDAACDGVLDFAADLVERLPDLEVDRRRALAAGQGQAGLSTLTEIKSTWHSARRRGCSVVAPGVAPRSTRLTTQLRTDTCALMPACRSARKFSRSPSWSSSMSSFNLLTTKSAALVGTSPG